LPRALSRIKYFAYGEKMLSPQIHSIIPSAQPLGVVKIIGYKLYFHHRCITDPSGKCNIVPVKDNTCEVYGVLYEIPTEDRYLLDESEGLGDRVQEITLTVFPVDPNKETKESAFTYVAQKDTVFEDLVPFTWYKEMVIIGAREHHIPHHYIHHLEQIASAQDPNYLRANKQKRYLDSLSF